MKDTLKLSIALGLISGLAAVLLVKAHLITGPKIKEVERKAAAQSLKTVLPDFDNDPFAEEYKKEFEDEGVKFYRAEKDGKLVGIAGEGAGKGFGGDVNLVIGFNPDGSVRSVVVTKHTETPGIGTTITERVVRQSFWDLFKKQESAEDMSASLAPNRWLDQYAGLNVSKAPFTVGDGGTIKAKTGATITSRAVAGGVSKICRSLEAHKSEIITD